MVSVPSREERLYRLNGRLASIMKQLGSCVGEARMICDASDDLYKYLSRIYDDVKITTNHFHARYLEK